MSQSHRPSLDPAPRAGSAPRDSRSASSVRLRSSMSLRRAGHAVGPAVGVAEALAAVWIQRTSPSGRTTMRNSSLQARRQPGQVIVDRALRAFAVVGVDRHACRTRVRVAGGSRAMPTCRCSFGDTNIRRSRCPTSSGPRWSRSSRARSAPPTSRSASSARSARRCRSPSRPCGTACPARRGCTARARAPSGTRRRRAARGIRLRRPGFRPQVRADSLGAQRRVVRMHAQRRNHSSSCCNSGPGGRP